MRQKYYVWQNLTVNSLVTVLLKITLFLCVYFVFKKLIILSLFIIITLNFTMNILTNLTCPLKIYVIRLHDPISINISFTKKDDRFFKRKPKKIIKWRNAIVWNAHFYHQDHLNFVKYLINVNLLKNIYINS